MADVSALTAGTRPEPNNKGGNGRIYPRSRNLVPGAQMRIVSLAVLTLLTVAACESRPGDETGRAADTGVDAADTMVTTDQTLDTTIVTEDTSVDVDTVSKEGDETVGRDTLQK
jgi:hypothetical protein